MANGPIDDIEGALLWLTREGTSKVASFFDKEGKIFVVCIARDGRAIWTKGSPDDARKIASLLLENAAAVEAYLAEWDPIRMGA